MDLVERFFQGLMCASLVSFLISALIVKWIEATLYSGLIMVLSIIAIHEHRLIRLEKEAEEHE